MHAITSLELSLAIGELKGRIEGSYLKKFYDLGDGQFRFLFHSREGNMIVYCNLASTFNKTSFLEESKSATNFAIAMRRRIEDSRVISIMQHNSDRIVVMELESKGIAHRIVVEMFAKGNLVLADAQWNIELCYRIASYKDREIRPRERYMFPESNSVAMEGLSDDAISDMLSKASSSGARMIAELSKTMNIGPLYLENIITSAGLDPKAALGSSDVGRLGQAMRRFMERLRQPEPVAYIRDGKIVDYAVVPLKKYEGLALESFASVNDMLDRAWLAERGRSTAADQPHTKEVEEIEASLGKQKQLVDEFNSNSAMFAEYARAIFQRMGEINALVARIRELKKPSAQELREEFEDLNITEINLKDKKVIIDI